MIVIIIFFVAHWYLHLFFHSFLFHRYASHRMFTMSRGWENAFRIMAFFVHGSSTMSLRAYSIMHQMHHLKTGTKGDPHPAEMLHGFKGMTRLALDMRLMHKNYLWNKYDPKDPNAPTDTVLAKAPKESQFEKIVDKWHIRLFFVGLYVAFYAVFAPSAWWFLLIPIHVAMGPVHGIIVNWFNHKVGYRNYILNNDSTNIEIKMGAFVIPWLIGLIMLGENNHNNHHNKISVNYAEKWFEFDPIYPVTLVLHWLHVIRIEPAFR